MKNNCSKTIDTCDGLKPSLCIIYEGETNTLSEIKEECPLTIEATTQDVYNQLEEINLTSLGSKCLQYIKTTKGKTIVKNVLLKYEEVICDLIQRVEALENQNQQ